MDKQKIVLPTNGLSVRGSSNEWEIDNRKGLSKVTQVYNNLRDALGGIQEWIWRSDTFQNEWISSLLIVNRIF